ncbi:MAG TPA: hypothetical protein VNO23_10195 [Candidatus Binatia bacterium]|nr:hypothetical protein [Candidatus Binatia bacterium]
MAARIVEPLATLRPVYQPGLDVGLAADLLGAPFGLVLVEVVVRGGQGPFSIALYVNGDPVGVDGGIDHDEGTGRLRCILDAAPGPQPLALTARVVDARGRWGGAALVLPAGPVGVR